MEPTFGLGAGARVCLLYHVTASFCFSRLNNGNRVWVHCTIVQEPEAMVIVLGN